MRKLSDAQVRAALRAALTRHRVSLSGLTLHCANGTVRLLGSLTHAGIQSRVPLRTQEVESIDQEIQHLPGVSRVHYDLRNWRRSESGNWTFVHARSSSNPSHPAGTAEEGHSLREF